MCTAYQGPVFVACLYNSSLKNFKLKKSSDEWAGLGKDDNAMEKDLEESLPDLCIDQRELLHLRITPWQKSSLID